MTKIKSNEALYLDMYDAILINKTMKADEATWLRFMELMNEVEGLEEARSCNDSSYSRKVISAKTHEAVSEMLREKARNSLREAERCAPAMKDGTENDTENGTESDTGRETMAADLEMDVADKASWLKVIETVCLRDGLEEARAYNDGAFYNFENISQEMYEAAEQKLKEIAQSV